MNPIHSGQLPSLNRYRHFADLSDTLSDTLSLTCL